VADDFSQAERLRYSRHLILPEVGIEGQRRLKRARVLVIGAGGLGSPVSMYLAAAGVGTIGLVDFDNVDLSNLQRQILHSTSGVGSSKLKSAEERLGALNPEINIVLHETRINQDNACSIIEQYDLVIDGTDNFSTRYLVNDACVILKKPNVYGSIFRFEGQATVFEPGSGPCYRCLFPYPPPPEAVPNCAEGGVLGVVAGTIGLIQATEALKLILGLGQGLRGKLLLYDAIEMRIDRLQIARDPQCPVCGDNPTITTVSEITFSCATGEDDKAIDISPVELNNRLTAGDTVFLLDVRNQEEFDLCRLQQSTLIPLRELEDRLSEINRSQEIVVYCKSGGRSKIATNLLLENGFPTVQNLSGGILAWIAQIDPGMQSY